MNIEELRKKSDQVELERKLYWEKEATEVSDVFLLKFEKMSNDSTAIYWREVNWDGELTRGEKKYLQDKGFTVFYKGGINWGHDCIKW